MSLKQTKTPIMGLAALFILLYHLLPLPRPHDAHATLIRYIVTTGYIGVDLFFFMSGYMAAYSDTSNYFSYVRRKFLRIYPMFLAFALISLLMGGLELKRAGLTLVGLDLFIRGGGSFLWFVPSLILFYLAAPLYLRLQRRLGNWQSYSLAMAFWLTLMLLLEQSLSQHVANIFLCRIPVILLGLSLGKYEDRWTKAAKLLAGLLLFSLGVLLTWNFVYQNRVVFLISDIFYLIALPLILGTLLLADVLFSSFQSRLFYFMGGISFELYCVQMVFGPLFFERAYSFTKHTLLSFALALGLVFLLSYLTSLVRKIRK